jgi:DNA replication protein DnaC
MVLGRPRRVACLKAVENGFGVAFFRLEELINELRRDADVAPARMRRRKYVNVALLIVDEMGLEPMSRRDATLFFRQVNYRYGRGSLLITTNKGIKDWPELFAGDESWQRPSSTGCCTTASS